MSPSAFELSSFSLIDSESLGLPAEHARAIEMFRDSVVLPSLRAIDQQIEESERSSDPAMVFWSGDLADLFASTVEGHLLTVQSMWERALRRLLIKRDKHLCGGLNVEALKKAVWSGGKHDLQAHFERLLGFPLAAFDSYWDLDLLQCFGNAIRHGDGRSAERIHEIAPSLWWNWLPPGTETNAGPFTISIPDDWPKHPSFERITLCQSVLEQMIRAVAGFWIDLEFVRCNSFRRKHETVQRLLDAWPSERAMRRASRLWTPS